jgi:general stress protein 26
MSHTKDISTAPALDTKITDLSAYLDKHKFLLLTTRAPNGALHARTMAPAERTKDMRLKFIYDNTSYKENELDNE